MCLTDTLEKTNTICYNLLNHNKKAGVTMQTNSAVNSSYKYYAFISYSSKDHKLAKWLQNKLENYRLPSKIRKANADIPKRLVPIFRDKTDLNGVVLEESLKKELDSSKFLIVLCSSNSKNSTWVNKEIEYFKSIGKADFIIPVMLEDNTDCFPEEIRNITPSLLGINITEKGKKYAFLQIVSTLLNIRFDDLAKRDKKRTVKRRAAVSIVTAAAVLIGSYVLYYNAPHIKYYNDVVYYKELPCGIYELSEAEVKNQACSYKITTKRNKTVSVEKVNSQEQVTDSPVYLATTQYPLQFFTYDENGKLISVEYANKNRETVIKKNLSHSNSSNEISIEFQNAENNTKISGLLADTYLNVPLDTGGKSEISRQLNSYDEKGLLTETVFHRDNLETPACDSLGVYGKKYEYNEAGQITSVTNLNADGEAFNCRYGWAKVLYEYDNQGNCVAEQYIDKDNNKVSINTGISAILMTYDENNNILSFSYSDENGNPCRDSSGVSKLACSYKENGLMSDYRCFDENGSATVNSEGIHKTQIEYDENGFQEKISFYSAEEDPVFSLSYGCYQYVMKPDSLGRIEEAWFCDSEGKPMTDEITGACGNRFVYDKKGYLNEVHYLDREENSIITTSGFASFVITRNDLGQVLKEETFDESNKLICSINNYAVAEYKYDSFGNITEVSFFDENNNPCNHIDGYSTLKYKYEYGNLTETYCYDINGAPTLCNENYHLVYYIYQNGNLVHTSYYDTNIKLISNSFGYAIAETDYDESGNAVTDAYYNENSKPIAPPNYYLIKHKYDKLGNDIRTDYYTTESSKPHITVITNYDSYGNALYRMYYNSDGILFNVE